MNNIVVQLEMKKRSGSRARVRSRPSGRRIYARTNRQKTSRRGIDDIYNSGWKIPIPVMSFGFTNAPPVVAARDAGAIARDARRDADALRDARRARRAADARDDARRAGRGAARRAAGDAARRAAEDAARG